MLKRLSRWIPVLWSNWLSLTGLVITTVAGCSLVFALAMEIVAPTTNVYATTFIFLGIPVVFAIGLALMPLGIFVYRNRSGEEQEREESLQAAFADLLKRPKLRRRFTFVMLASFINIVLLGSAGNRAIHFMDTAEFCGQTCHNVMQPEFEAYERSPHSRVHCVDCHIGPGASWAVQAKIDGLRQVWGVMTNEFSRPIPTPVHTLRPARDTCEQCHWPAKFHGSYVKFKVHYENDEANTPQVNAVMLKVGGEAPKSGDYEGIHWHVSKDVEVRYEALDEKRSKIGKITVLKDGEVVKEFAPREGDEGEGAIESRTMDCIDCHNRPTHVYDGTPEQALDAALTAGRADASLPYFRKLALPLLQRADRSRDTVRDEMLAELSAAYDKEHPDLKPDAEKLAKAADALAEVYRRNIFPDMKVTWDTYPTNIGHLDMDDYSRGCFRCHDDTHATADGDTLSQDCDLCHNILAEEEKPEDLAEPLGDLYRAE